MSTTEERVAMLEQGLLSMGEAIARVEKAVEKMDSAVTSLVDKLDSRYPSKESVDLRFGDVSRENEQLHKEVSALGREVTKLRAWQYKIMGASAVVAFLLGLAAEALRSWKG